jgi:hypothetical protein
MSAIGTEQISKHCQSMSAFGGKADTPLWLRCSS